MNLVLVGYRGTGKSTVASELSRRMARPVISLDRRIVERAGKPIPEIVAERGWAGFRDLEQQICTEYAGLDELILDCGGGVVEREANVQALRQNGKLVWLRAEVDTIVARIQNDTERPSLTAKGFLEEVAEVLDRRTRLYRGAAHLEVATDGRDVSDIAREISTWFDAQAGRS
jgi:shikimate kinase